jgi:STE24 endopeptidase
MKIEQKYGFNRSSMKTFVFDMIRSVLLTAALSLALAELMTLFEFGDWPIFVFAAAIFVFTLLVALLYPYLSRIGNKFTPLEDGELKDKLMALLSRNGYRVKAIEVMDASRRTTKSNAYFTGFGKMKRIVLYDTLLENMTTDEICAIFAHEMGHGLHKDILKRQFLNIGNFLILSLAVWITVKFPIFCTAFGFSRLNYGFVFLIVGIWLDVLQPLTNLVLFANTRADEYRADKQAVVEGYGEAMISALKKLAKDNFAHLAPSKINVILEYTHPPVSERIANIEKNLSK